MSLALSSNNEKNYARLNTSLFYLILASFQYIMTSIIFLENYTFPSDYKLIFVVVSGVILGNLFSNFLKDKTFKKMVNLLAVLSAFILTIS